MSAKLKEHQLYVLLWADERRKDGEFQGFQDVGFCKLHSVPFSLKTPFGEVTKPTNPSVQMPTVMGLVKRGMLTSRVNDSLFSITESGRYALERSQEILKAWAQRCATDAEKARREHKEADYDFTSDDSADHED